ncbi:MAG: hypothetical protein ACK463_42830, partial [Bradyrhizobium sp.]
IEAAELKRRDAVERQRIDVELALESERIASSRTREVLNIDQKKAIELADEERVIALAAKRSERIDADRQVRQAEIAFFWSMLSTSRVRDEAIRSLSSASSTSMRCRSTAS